MIHNKTLKETWEALGNLPSKWKDAVKLKMGWRSDNPFYYRINGQIKCSPAEQAVFAQTLSDLVLNKPATLFPATEETMVTAE